MNILVSALEPSANLHLKAILESDLSKELKISGIFDESLGKPFVSSNEFNVMGIFSLIPKIWKAKKSIDLLVKKAVDFEKILLIDSPAFNIPLARKLKERYPNIEIIYYILPKVWAWKEGRKKLIEKYVDISISIFPFEKQYYPNSLFFGNPILEEINNFRETVLEDGNISFLAGSRKNEIKNLMPIFREILKKIDSKKAVLVIPPHIKDFSIYGDISRFEISRDTKESLNNSKFAFICSGTATLESAIIGTPFTLLYKTNPIEYAIARIFVKLKYVGLANIIFEKSEIKENFHSEHLQNIDIEKVIYDMQNVDKQKFLKNSKKLRKLLSGNFNQEIIKIILDKN